MRASSRENTGTIPWSLKRYMILVSAGLGTATAGAAAAVHWSTPSGAPAPPRLLIYAVVVAFSGFLVLFEAGETRGRWILLTPWVVYGALLATVAAGPLFLAPWLLAATAAFAVAALTAGVRGLKGLAARSGIALVSALASFAFLWLPLTSGGRQISAEEFRSLDLRVHSSLADVPLHDAWVVDLPGGGEGRTLDDVRAVALQRAPADVSTIVAGLIGLRTALGDALNLDGEQYLAPSPSYAQLLAAAEQSPAPAPPHALRPPIPPGGIPAAESSMGVFRPVYALQDEALLEMSNRTGHAYIAAALRPAPEGGYKLYWGIYVEDRSWVTPIYMALIDPFRRHLVYPAALSNIERSWRAQFDRTRDE